MNITVHKFIKSKDFPKTCRVCGHIEKSMGHSSSVSHSASKEVPSNKNGTRMVHEPKADDWEKEFDEKFTDNPVFWAELNAEWQQGDIDVKPFKQFIATLLQEQRDSIGKEVVRKLKQAEIACGGSCGAGCEYAVQDLIKAFSKRGSKK